MGKISFLQRLIKNIYPDPGLTSPVENFSYMLQRSIKIDFWAVCGNDRFIPMWKLYYPDSNCVLIFYDITDRESFDLAKNFIIKEIEHLKNNADFFVFLIGNKLDLAEEKRKVSFQEGQIFADELGCPFLEISCTNSTNIQEFKEIFTKGL